MSKSAIRVKTITSEVVAVGEGEILLTVDQNYVHNYAGVIFYNSSSGTVPLDPSGLTGSTTFTVKTLAQPQGYQTLPANIVAANALGQVNWAANTLEVKAVFAALTGATHARLVFIGNGA